MTRASIFRPGGPIPIVHSYLLDQMTCRQGCCLSIIGFKVCYTAYLVNSLILVDVPELDGAVSAA
jgi:hypothetical protein